MIKSIALTMFLFCITQATADSSEVIVLTLHYSEGSITEKSVTIIPGFISQEQECKKCEPGRYIAKIYNSNGEVLHSTSLADPSIVFYDYLSEDGKLTGGIVKLKQKDFVVRLPVLTEMTEIKILSPQGEELFSITKQEIRTSKEEIKWACSTLIYNGPVQNRIDLVILGDGYTNAQLSTYRSNVNNFVNYLSATVSPHKEYLSYYNVHRVDVISPQSGADHPLQNIYVNTELDASYSWGGGPERLLYCSESKAWTAATSAPSADVVVVIVNDNLYGGGGGGMAVSYNGTDMNQVIAHEAGHSYGQLMDEYSYGTSGSLYNSGANCEYDYNQSNPKWSIWADQGVSWYSTCSYTNLGRPTSNNCMMRSLMDNFCVVCREQSVKEIYGYISTLIDTTYPDSSSFSISLGDSAQLKITKKPTVFSDEVKWFINNSLQPSASIDSFLFIPTDTGAFQVKVTVLDTTPMVRIAPPPLIVNGSQYIWNITVTPSTQQFDIPVSTGWNMVSIPVTPANPSPSAVFPANTGIYEWDGSAYITPTTIVVGQGYWVLYLSSTTVTVTGTPVTSYTRSIPAGWNMIGSVVDTVLESQIVTNPTGRYISGSLQRWNTATGTYEVKDRIIPTGGYWTAFSGACAITIAGTKKTTQNQNSRKRF